MSVNFKKFERAFNQSAKSEENLLSDRTVNWNFVDADVFLALMDEPFLPDHKLAELIDEVSFEIIDEGV